jgi:hypothetical protein
MRADPADHLGPLDDRSDFYNTIDAYIPRHPQPLPHEQEAYIIG